MRVDDPTLVQELLGLIGSRPRVQALLQQEPEFADCLERVIVVLRLQQQPTEFLEGGHAWTTNPD